MPLLVVQNLRTHFRTPAGVVRAVDGISFTVSEGEVVALVGESGSGKSVTSLSVMGLVPKPAGFHAGGEILYRGKDLTRIPENELRELRGKEISLVFQDPMNSLNPVMTCGKQVEEGLRLHQGVSGKQAREQVLGLFRDVGIPDPERRMGAYPHELSGGMRQRVVIAMALACGPHLLIADEPTTALDVTVQAQILDLLLKLQASRNMGVLLITHDLAVVAETADRVAVMYAGKIVETASVEELFARPRHPYTRALLDSMPARAAETGTTGGIEGNVPDALDFPSGCRFHPRCAFATEICAQVEPSFDGRVACHHPLEVVS